MAAGSNRETRLNRLLSREIHPDAGLSSDAASILDKMLSNFVSRSLMNGGAVAEDRNAQEVRMCDMRPFVQDQLRLDVPGFAMDDLVDEAGVGSRAVFKALRRKQTSKKHLTRIKHRNQAVEAEVAAADLAQLQKKHLAATAAAGAGTKKKTKVSES